MGHLGVYPFVSLTTTSFAGADPAFLHRGEGRYHPGRVASLLGFGTLLKGTWVGL